MKVEIPETLKADIPQTTWGKILTATQVVMAVLATMLAGLASSEMTRAHYDRALAAQQQSKAGDQWSFFQAKRLRGALQRNTADLMQSTVEIRLLELASLRSAAKQLTAVQLPPEAKAEAGRLKTDLLRALASPAGQNAISTLRRFELPPGGKPVAPPPEVNASLEALERMRSDPEIILLLAKVSDKTLDAAAAAARDRALNFDAATAPVNQAIDQIDNLR